MNFHGRRPLFNVAVGGKKKKKIRNVSRPCHFGERFDRVSARGKERRDSIDLFLQGFVNLDNYLDN